VSIVPQTGLEIPPLTASTGARDLGSYRCRGSQAVAPGLRRLGTGPGADV